jgi:putative membrane protein
MLASHIALAMLIVPLVLTTLTLALRDKRERHRAWARWTFPIWYYVSVTGVLIYLFLYVWW